MEEITIKKLGPIEDIRVSLGDLTVLTGVQASGKSLFLQILKLLIDKNHIAKTLDQYNYVLTKNPQNILNVYLGEGMADIWTDETIVIADRKSYKKNFLLSAFAKTKEEKLFYIPAQRILSIADGRPKNFMEFDLATPYVLRFFSETLRLFFQNGMGEEHILFPLSYRLKSTLKKSFNTNIFHGGEVVIDEKSGQKKMRMKIGNMSLPFMTWSAGQKEFMPLLMAFYCLSGPKQRVVNREQYEYIVIEEPEMGLHPQAIQAVILQIIEFLQMGYKVIVSTHSPVLLEFVWAYNLLKEIPETVRKNALYELFNISKQQTTRTFFDTIFDKSIKTYYFSRKNSGVTSVDISNLDVYSENVDISEWGGLSQFSTKTSEVISKYIAEYGE